MQENNVYENAHFPVHRAVFVYLRGFSTNPCPKSGPGSIRQSSAEFIV
jgi:hypothetical protein